MTVTDRGAWLTAIEQVAGLAYDVYMTFRNAGFDTDPAIALTLRFLEEHWPGDT